MSQALHMRDMAKLNTFLFKNPDVSNPSVLPNSLTLFHDLTFLCNPAFTESAFVGCHYEAFQSTARRLYYEEEHQGVFQLDHDKGVGDFPSIMDLDIDSGLHRTGSHHSTASRKSSRSQTVRVRPRKYSSYVSSSASSISDKSLTSFPSFSPESPNGVRTFQLRMKDGHAQSSRKPSDPPTIVESLIVSSPSAKSRSALFDEDSLSTSHVPGAIHLANDEHIERLIARNGAVALVRQIAEDLAQRDTQVAALRRKGEERERALRKIILECGLSNLDLETRLRAIEGEQKAAVETNTFSNKDAGLTDMMSDAMSEEVVFGDRWVTESDGTIRARDALRALQGSKPPNTNATRGWKDYIWGTGTSRKSSGASSIEEGGNGLRVTTTTTKMRNGSGPGRQTILENGIFQPPEGTQPASRSSSVHSSNVAYPSGRKSSTGLATLALKLVAGTTARDESTNARGRANSTNTPPAGRVQSTASAKTTMSANPAPTKPATKAIATSRRPAASVSSGTVARGQQPDRWDTMGTSPESTRAAGADNYGPVEMDTILPPDAQPPTVTATYNNTYNQEFLTDRFGFIYDQRRKKRQREAAEKVQKSKRGSRVEMLSSGRGGLAPESPEDVIVDERPDTPLSIEDDGKPAKRWQDYLKIATFPTELLSHTPSGGIPAFEVMEGGEVPKSPGITTEERGFLPSSTATTAPPAVSVTSDHATMSKPDVAAPPISPELSHEDTEPVKLLLKQLGDVHDSLQKEKTVKWNDFLRKVRAERKRDGEAAVAAALAADTRSQRAMTIMPEASLTDGEMIGVAGLGNKGKVGRAKWAEFKMLLLGGIPVAFRAKIWAECSGATALRIPGYYEDLAHKEEDGDDPSIVAQIQMDINRTLTDNIFFRKGPGVAKLNEVLLAYSRRNAEVGYCQGMNLITACLLLIMPTAEDAFWVLTSIIESILPRGYYDHSLLASRADQQVLRQYVTEILPKLSAHFDDLSIELETLTFQWFLSVFTDCLSAEALFRVWDVVLCTNDGSTFLFQVALALLKLNEPQLLHCDTPATVYTYINHQMTNHAISIDGLIHASEGLRKVVKRDEVETRRGLAIEAEKDLIRQREERNAQRKAERIAAMNGTSEEPMPIEIPPTPSREEGQLELGVDEGGELTVRTPLPVDEDMEMGLG